MASKADRSAIAIISTIHGAVRVLMNEKRFSVLDIRKDLEAFNQQVSSIRDRYYHDYNEKDIVWTVEKLDAWGEVLEDLDLPGSLHTAVLVKVATMALDDLLVKVGNRVRVVMLMSLQPTLMKCLDFVDPEGRGFSSYETADMVLAALYKEIEFQP